MLNLLEGVRVVETASFLMGPIAGRILADWGAAVVKIEPATVTPPFDGDQIRGSGLARGIMNGDPCLYQFVNGNKRSVALDTRSKQGQIIQQKLCASADIVIHHIAVADQKRLGIDYESLSKIKPGIIVATTTGYGVKGPDKDRPGFDAVAYGARSGMLTGCTNDGVPYIPFMGYGDVPAGTYLAAAILAAYIRKLRTGEGEDVTCSLYGSAIWTAGFPIMSAGYGDPYPTPMAAAMPTARMYKCADDKWLYLMANNWDNAIPELKKIMPSFPADAEKRWPSYFAAKAATAEISGIIANEFAQHEREYWIKKLSTVRIPFDVINTFADIQKDKHAWDAGFLIKPTNGGETSCEYNTGIPTTPGQFKHAGTPELSTCPVGQHTREELKNIGYTDEQVDKFRAKKCVTEGDQFEVDHFNVTKPGTFYNMVFMGSKK